jgi:hypothetical protein
VAGVDIEGAGRGKQEHPTGDDVAKPNFGFQKQQRERAKEQKKKEKEARKEQRRAEERAAEQAAQAAPPADDGSGTP